MSSSSTFVCSESSENSQDFQGSESSESFDSGFELVDAPNKDTRARLDAVVDRVKIDNLKRQLEGTWKMHFHTDGDDFLRAAGDDDFSRALFYSADKEIGFPAENCMEIASRVNSSKYKLLRIPLGGDFHVAQLGVTSYFTENSVKVVWGLDEEAGMNSEEMVVVDKQLQVINKRFDTTCTRTYIKLDHLDSHLSQLDWLRVDNSELDARCARLELENSELFLEKTMMKWQITEMERQLRHHKLQQPSTLAEHMKGIDDMLRKLQVTSVHPNLILKPDGLVEMPEIYTYILGSWEVAGSRASVPTEYQTMTYAYNTSTCKLWRKLNEGPFEELKLETVVLDDNRMLIVENENWKYMRLVRWEKDQLQGAAVNNGRVEFITVYKRV